MTRKAAGALAALAAVFTVLVTAGTARAVDAPKWVAALYVEAQKMVGLRWVPAPGATGYKILRSTTAGSGYQEIATAATPQHLDKDLEPGTTYYYVLQSVAGAETSANSEERKVVIPGEKKVQANLPPEWDKLTLNESTQFGKTTFKVGVFWKPTGNPSVVAHNLYRSTEPGKGYQLLTSIPETRYVDSTVEEGKTYYYVVTSLNNAFEESPYSKEEKIAVVKATPVAGAAPAAKKKEYPKLVPLPSQKGEVKKLPNDPFDLAQDSRGTLYVGAGYLYKIEGIDGELQQIENENFSMVNGIGIGTGDELLVTVLNSNTALVISGAKVKVLTVPPPSTPLKNADGKIIPIAPTRPGDITQNVDGKYWITDTGNNCVMLFDDDGKFLQVVEAGSTHEIVVGATSIAHNSKGTVFVASGAGNFVNIYDKDGKWLGEFGETGNIAGTFGRIGTIFVDAQDNLWITDVFNTTVQKFDSEGKFLGALASPDKKGGSGLATPTSIVFDSKVKKGIAAQGIDRSLVEITLLE